jgi:delta 1-pyrroline-5-carboxylate dehydrogenase
MAVPVQFDSTSVKDCVTANFDVLLLVLSTFVIGYFGLSLMRKPHVPVISVPLPVAARPGWSSTVLESPSILGEDPSLRQCFCPATGQLISSVNVATTAVVDTAIKKARSAQLQWRSTSFEQRAHVLRTLLKFILEHQEDIARVSCRDSGV